MHDPPGGPAASSTGTGAGAADTLVAKATTTMVRAVKNVRMAEAMDLCNSIRS
ncbi:hypothetical protein M422DRAFT_37117 [Sphaerobolus stellatus SS14]|uniref:Uncharacterized protein n=1 Tax=Sphaerobolus stellatus (strain SS14) TaxID=990650 RepID=A0A0C9U458_SPHS4|nr:hypothetical protein M422DRAFT_37117 [Sphaerobolus stellatus SS14]